MVLFSFRSQCGVARLGCRLVRQVILNFPKGAEHRLLVVKALGFSSGPCCVDLSRKPPSRVETLTDRPTCDPGQACDLERLVQRTGRQTEIKWDGEMRIEISDRDPYPRIRRSVGAFGAPDIRTLGDDIRR